jgi:hypothetical protein
VYYFSTLQAQEKCVSVFFKGNTKWAKSKPGLNHIDACGTLAGSPTTSGKADYSHSLTSIWLPVAAQNVRVLITKKPPVCAVFPHEWNQCAIRSICFTFLQVVHDRVIESEEQRVVAEAVKLPAGN